MFPFGGDIRHRACPVRIFRPPTERRPRRPRGDPTQRSRRKIMELYKTKAKNSRIHQHQNRGITCLHPWDRLLFSPVDGGVDRPVFCTINKQTPLALQVLYTNLYCQLALCLPQRAIFLSTFTIISESVFSSRQIPSPGVPISVLSG